MRPCSVVTNIISCILYILRHSKKVVLQILPTCGFGDFIFTHPGPAVKHLHDRPPSQIPGKMEFVVGGDIFTVQIVLKWLWSRIF